MKLILALGLDWRILIAQLFNFAILVFVLWRFAYKPVFKLLEERREKIAQGVKDSEDAGVKLGEAVSEKKALIAEARKESVKIIDEAKEKAEIKYQEIIAKSKNDIKLIIEEEKLKIAAEKNVAFASIKDEAAKMISLALEKILPQSLDNKRDGELIAKAIKDLK